MKTLVVLHVADGLSEEEVGRLRQLLCDALGEFETARGPSTETYVRRRYKLVGKQYDHKLAEVDARKALAARIKHAVNDFTVTHVADE